MINYDIFLNKLASLATSYDDNTSKSIELLRHFQYFLDTIIHLENKYLLACDSENLQRLLNEADIVKKKLYNLEQKNGEILFIIGTKYQLFYKELEFGITSHIIEKYLNIIYTIIYVYENNSVSFNTYREMGIFAMNFISDLTSEFLNEDSSLEDLMSNFRI
jgi:hypothetical protein